MIKLQGRTERAPLGVSTITILRFFFIVAFVVRISNCTWILEFWEAISRRPRNLGNQANTALEDNEFVHCIRGPRPTGSPMRMTVEKHDNAQLGEMDLGEVVIDNYVINLCNERSWILNPPRFAKLSAMLILHVEAEKKDSPGILRSSSSISNGRHGDFAVGRQLLCRAMRFVRGFINDHNATMSAVSMPGR